MTKLPEIARIYESDAPWGARNADWKFEKNQIQTYSGVGYDFENPQPEQILFTDIAHALSQACRFAGHTSRFCSVAEHSLLVSHILERQGYNEFTQRLGLLHDAHEAYVWDVPRPFKPLLGDTFARFADKADDVIAKKFIGYEFLGFDFDHCHIKSADNMALVAEGNELMHYGPEHWASWDKTYSKVDPLPDGLMVNGYEPGIAKYLFIQRAQELAIPEAEEL